jgi:pimeloyl-ACP methyl ester carboxylesterase
MTGVLLIILLVLAIAIAAWVAFVQGRYPLAGTRPERLRVITTDGWTLSVFHRPALVRRFEEPIVLCHGLANNHSFLEFQEPQNLAQFLSALGFECYAVDLRGAGTSTPPGRGRWDVSIDDHIRYDVPAVVDLVLSRAKSKQLIWLGHSLGGLVGLAAAPTALGHVLAALVTIGSPVFFHTARGTTTLLKLAQLLSPRGSFDSDFLRYLSPLVGMVPPQLAAASANLRNIDRPAQRKLLANVFSPLWRGVLAQLEDWVSTNSFRSKDLTIDYREGLKALQCPVLVIGGSVDQLSPESATREYFAALTSPGRELAMFGRAYGHRAEYGHGDLIVGTLAHEEVYPIIGDFLARHATKVTVEAKAEVVTGEPLQHRSG